jgi:hypothetical protein
LFCGSTHGRIGYGLVDSGFVSRQRKDIFSSPKPPDWLWGSLRLLFSGYLGFALLVNWPGHDVEVKNVWSNTSIPPVCLHGFDKDNFILLQPHSYV